MSEQQQTGLAEVLEHVEGMMVSHPRDWGAWHRDAWLYGILVGWDCEKQHGHDDVCENGAAMRELAAKHGWPDSEVARVRRYREAVRRASGARTTPDNPLTSGDTADNPGEAS